MTICFRAALAGNSLAILTCGACAVVAAYGTDHFGSPTGLLLQVHGAADHTGAVVHDSQAHALRLPRRRLKPNPVVTHRQSNLLRRRRKSNLNLLRPAMFDRVGDRLL